MTLQNIAPQSMTKNDLWTYARDGVVLADLTTGEILDINPAAELLLQRTRAEVVGTNQEELYPPEQRPKLLDLFTAAMHDHGLMQGLSVLRPDGTLVPVEISATEPFSDGHRQVVMGIFRDVRRELEDRAALEKRAWALEAYANAADALGNATSVAQLVEGACQSIVKEATYILAWVGLAEDGPGKLIQQAGCAGPARQCLDGLVLSWADAETQGCPPTGRCIQTRAPVVIDNVDTDPLFAPWREHALLHGIRSTFSVPLLVGAKCLGALTVGARIAEAFRADDVALFARLANQVAYGLETLNRKHELDAQRAREALAQWQLSKALEATIGAMSATMEQRDPYTAGHERRVGEIAVAIGTELGWDKDRLHGLMLAALVHDVGKIAVPIEILTKPTKLSVPEFELIKTHAEMGYQIMKDVPFPWQIARMIREHHERIDGSGYPKGLKGDALLLDSKVLAVADIVESMASARPYRMARGLEVTLKEIEAQSGSKLDAEVCSACLRLFREKSFQLPT